MRNKRIAVIGLKGLPAFGGAATVGESIINELSYKYNFTVYSISSHTKFKTGYYNKLSYQIVVNSLGNKKLNVIYYYLFSAIHALFSSYDIVHLHHRDASFILPILRLKYKVILTTHGMELTDKWKKFSFLFKLQDKLFLRLTSIITTVSLKDFRLVNKALRNRSNIQYIPNGVSLAALNNIYSNQTIIFAAGRIIPNKGCHTFLEALIKMKYLREIVIIGDLNQMQSYNTKIKDLAKSLENIKFVGLIRDRNILNQYLRNTQLFVYPSEIESMSMMLLEVASLRTPIICADIQENKDIFDDSEVLFFKKSNSDELSEKIKWAQSNYGLMQDKAERAYTKLKLNYQWKDISKKYSQVYDKFLF
jgi:glycosyltransferase involved in cell wall biosynthesis